MGPQVARSFSPGALIVETPQIIRAVRRSLKQAYRGDGVQHWRHPPLPLGLTRKALTSRITRGPYNNWVPSIAGISFGVGVMSITFGYQFHNKFKERTITVSAVSPARATSRPILEFTSRSLIRKNSRNLIS